LGFSFSEMNIPFGAELVSVANGEKVIVVGGRLINFWGQETSLANTAQIILDKGCHAAPGPYWTFNGKVEEPL
jgi:hypothetical protein